MLRQRHQKKRLVHKYVHEICEANENQNFYKHNDLALYCKHTDFISLQCFKTKVLFTNGD